LDEQIRDVIIKNTPHADARRQCLLDPNASLEDVLKKAQTYIKTLETDQVLKGDQLVHDVDKMSSTFKKKRTKPFTPKPSSMPKNKWKSYSQCFVKHERKNCPFKQSTCHKCGKKGHIKPVCRTKSSADEVNTVENADSIYDDGSFFTEVAKFNQASSVA